MTKIGAIACLLLAAFGLTVPNGLFLYYMMVEFASVSAVLHNTLAMAFILDAFMAMGCLAWWFARHPPGKYSWRLFVLLSLLGGLGFSLPLYYYLNQRDNARR